MAAQVAWGIVQQYRALCRLFLAGGNKRVFRLKEGLAGNVRARKHFPAPDNPAGEVDPYLARQLTGRREEILICLFYGEDGTFRAEQRRGGGLSTVIADRIDLAQSAVAHGARFAVLAHNHPSGVALPSAEDVEATRRLYRMFATLGTTLVDHVIVAEGAEFSFRLAGLI